VAGHGVATQLCDAGGGGAQLAPFWFQLDRTRKGAALGRGEFSILGELRENA
jgi:hypothetical protein